MLEEFKILTTKTNQPNGSSSNGSRPNCRGLVRLEPSARQFGLKSQLKSQIVFGAAARKDFHAQ
jgi:hypothetical protein